jgi:xylan 1,4-beta-xylosidase
MIQNPVLPGSNPDPSLLRVDDDYYLATSTFQWFPGIRLHHSRDLAHWRLCGHALVRPAQLDLTAVPDSGGVWAPSLSHHDGLFHLVYPVISARAAFPLVSVANYLVSAADIAGPWSDPVFLHGVGWDPSLFHDPAGRTWLLRMLLDVQPGHRATRGIGLQEYDWAQRRLVGPQREIFAGTARGCTEGPQLFRRGPYFYLVTAEGGTSWRHAVTVARSRELFGPYQADPAGPLLTAEDAPDGPLQKAGHGSVVSTGDGRWFMAHLATRPLGHRQSSPLGRETALLELGWKDGWPRLAHGDHHPRLQLPGLPEELPAPPPSARDDFDAAALDPEWNTLREPADPGWCTLAHRGHLRLRGREPLFSPRHQSVVARRLTSLDAGAGTSVRFEPAAPDEAAGLVCLQDTRDALFGCITFDPCVGKCVAMIHLEGGGYRTLQMVAPLPPGAPVTLSVRLSHPQVQFFWALPRMTPAPLGPAVEAAVLADDHLGKDAFTGAYVGMAAQDPAGQRWAEFDWFDYRPD